jgi:hypothetical protein
MTVLAVSGSGLTTGIGSDGIIKLLLRAVIIVIVKSERTKSIVTADAQTAHALTS